MSLFSHLNNFIRIGVLLHVCLYEGVRSLGTEVTDNCEPQYVDAGTRTQVLDKSHEYF